MKRVHTLPEQLKQKIKSDSAEIKALREKSDEKENILKDMLQAYMLGANLQSYEKIILNTDLNLEYEDTTEQVFEPKPQQPPQALDTQFKVDFNDDKAFPKFETP